ncbi:hypothetical protein CHISP_1457 [Chitinispirillum alkaliphilum]|nr:hypothetical protein CHISP_1457 [Chitinispirillum alkaliphilum]
MVIIKEVYPENAHLLLPIIHRTTLESYTSFYPQEAIDYFISHHSGENISKDIANGNAVCLLKENEIVGTGILVGSAVKRVFVLPEYQGSGFGTMIMDYLETKARERNLEFLYLHSSLPARRFYHGKGYKALTFLSIEVGNGKTLDYYHMGKKLTQSAVKPEWNLDRLSFKVVKNEGPEAEVDLHTTFTFYQKDEMVSGKYFGGQIAEGELIGYVDGSSLVYHYEQVNLSGDISSGISRNIIHRSDNGKIRLTDTWEWKSRQGKGHCILEEE